MQTCVLRLRHDFEVIGVVISRIFISMVDDFTRRKAPSVFDLRDYAVFVTTVEFNVSLIPPFRNRLCTFRCANLSC